MREEEKNYEEYRDKVMDAISQVYSNCIVALEKVTKVNVVKDGLTIREKPSDLARCIYLDDIYNITGGDISDSFSEICKRYETTKGICKRLDKQLNSFTKTDLAKRLYFKVINTEKNKEFLKTVPHRPCLEGLSIIYYILLSQDFNGASYEIVRNNMMLHYPFLEGMTEEDLYEQAVKNASTMEPKIYNMIEKLGTYICSVDDTIISATNFYGKTMDDAVIENDDIKKFFGNLVDEPPMYVFTNKAELNAFGLILVPEILETVVKFFKGDSFYIIPSSVHEAMLLPRDKFSDSEEIKEIIKKVNTQELSESDYLSDNLYLYDADIQQIVTVEE